MTHTITVAFDMSKRFHTVNTHKLINKVTHTHANMPNIIKFTADFKKHEQRLETQYIHNVNSKLAFHKEESTFFNMHFIKTYYS